jgi:hypothetical protein
MTTSITSLEKKFNALNKQYIKLDKTFTSDMTSSEVFEISEKLEDIQLQMSIISNKMENQNNN